MSSFTHTTICVVLASLAGAGTAAADVHINPDGRGGRSHAAVGAAAGIKTGMLGGASQQDEPVVSDVSRNRRAITLNVAYLADCATGSPAFSAKQDATAEGK